MCGIIGYIGKKEASAILIQALKKLEYRGYDSAGIAVVDNGKISMTKCKGKLFNLEKKLEENPLKGPIGIGHTRWATHGEPSDVNSHPHTNKSETISVVHNGIIENYMSLRERLISKGYEFCSDTDTEVIPHLIDYYYNGDLMQAVMKAVSKMKGSYAIGVVCSNEPKKLIATRKDSPLIVGVGKGESFIASDIPAVLSHTRDIYLMNDNEFVALSEEGVIILNDEGEEIKRDIFHVTWDADAAEKGGYDHFMLKEIHEQPKAIKDTMASRIIRNKRITLDNIKLTKEHIENIDKIYIVACGTASYASLIGKYVIEDLANIPVETECASEFRYRRQFINQNTLMILVSQSGETADTLAALRLAKKQGARVIAITNVVGSSIAREADDVLYTWAGPEIAVASTKAYLTQLIALNIIALYFAETKGTLTFKEIEVIKEAMLELPQKVERIISQKETYQKLAYLVYHHKDVYFFGRGLDYAVSLEGSMKLKETSYIHSEAYSGGELKHGPIALIEKGTMVIALATQNNLFEKMISNIKEVKSRGAFALSVAMEGSIEIEKVADYVMYIPKEIPILTPILSVVPLQMLAYYISVLRGCDVDKPRNLAKSVTVE